MTNDANPFLSKRVQSLAPSGIRSLDMRALALLQDLALSLDWRVCSRWGFLLVLAVML